MLGMRLCRHDGRGAEKGSRLFKEISDLLDYCSRHLGIYRYRPVDEGCIDSAVMAARNRRPRRRHLHDGFSEDIRMPELHRSASEKVIPTHIRLVSQAIDEHCAYRRRPAILTKKDTCTCASDLRYSLCH